MQLGERLDLFKEKLAAQLDNCTLMKSNVNANRMRTKYLDCKYDGASHDDFDAVPDLKIIVKDLNEDDTMQGMRQLLLFQNEALLPVDELFSAL